MKYIDAEKLKAALEARIEAGLDGYGGNLKWLLESIDSLQQEQNSLQDVELTEFESALFTAFSYAWQSYLMGEEVNVAQWAKENSAELLEAARCQQEQPKVDLEEYIENVVNHYGLSLYEASYRTFSACDIDRIIRNAFEFGFKARKA